MHDLATIIHLNNRACAEARALEPAHMDNDRAIYSANIDWKTNYLTKKLVKVYKWPLVYMNVEDATFDLLVQLRKEAGRANEAARGEKDKFTIRLTDRRLKALKVLFKYLFDIGEKWLTEWPIELAEEFDWIAAKIEGII